MNAHSTRMCKENVAPLANTMNAHSTRMCKENVAPLAITADTESYRSKPTALKEGVERIKQVQKKVLRASTLLNRSPLSDIINDPSPVERPATPIAALRESIMAARVPVRDGDPKALRPTETQHRITKSSSNTSLSTSTGSTSLNCLERASKRWSANTSVAPSTETSPEIAKERASKRWSANVDFHIDLSHDSDVGEEAMKCHPQVCSAGKVGPADVDFTIDLPADPASSDDVDNHAATGSQLSQVAASVLPMAKIEIEQCDVFEKQCGLKASFRRFEQLMSAEAKPSKQQCRDAYLDFSTSDSTHSLRNDSFSDEVYLSQQVSGEQTGEGANDSEQAKVEQKDEQQTDPIPHDDPLQDEDVSSARSNSVTRTRRTPFHLSCNNLMEGRERKSAKKNVDCGPSTCTSNCLQSSRSLSVGVSQTSDYPCEAPSSLAHSTRCSEGCDRDAPPSLAHSARCSEALFKKSSKKSCPDLCLSNATSYHVGRCRELSLAASESWDTMALPSEGRIVAPSQDASTLYTRGEAWLERKRHREAELREERARQDVRDCTFCPNTRLSSAAYSEVEATPKKNASVTKDQAQQFFQRHMAWKQRLDEKNDSQRKQKHKAAELEVRALAALRRSTSSGAGRDVDADYVLTQFYERNLAWQNDCEKRVERLYEEKLARQQGHSGSSEPSSLSERPGVRSAAKSSQSERRGSPRPAKSSRPERPEQAASVNLHASHGSRKRSSSAGAIPLTGSGQQQTERGTFVPQGTNESARRLEKLGLGSTGHKTAASCRASRKTDALMSSSGCSASAEGRNCSSNRTASQHASSALQQASATDSCHFVTPASLAQASNKQDATNGEHDEVMKHLQELRHCLLSSKCRHRAVASSRQKAQPKALTQGGRSCNCPQCSVASLWMVHRV